MKPTNFLIVEKKPLTVSHNCIIDPISHSHRKLIPMIMNFYLVLHFIIVGFFHLRWNFSSYSMWYDLKYPKHVQVIQKLKHFFSFVQFHNNHKTSWRVFLWISKLPSLTMCISFSVTAKRRRHRVHSRHDVFEYSAFKVLIVWEKSAPRDIEKKNNRINMYELV